MKDSIRLLLLLVTALSLSSCKKFLQEQTQDQLVPKTTRDFSELLFGDGYLRYLDPAPISTMLMDDDVESITNPSFGQGATFIQAAQSVLPVYSWQPDFFEQLNANTTTPGLREYNTWYVYYSKIAACNTALQYADGSTAGSQADKDYLKGEAYTLRAFYYFMLVNLYGLPYNAAGSDRATNPGVPLILTANFTAQQVKRSSVAEVYQQIISDLEAGVALLDQEKRSGSIFRMNYKGAHLLASRIYLHMEQWDKVILHANAVLEAQSTLMQLNTWGAANSTTKPILGSTNIETIWAYGTTNFLSTVKIGTGSGSAYYVNSTSLVNQYAGDDLRKGIYLIPKTPAQVISGGYTHDNGKWPYTYAATTPPVAKVFRVSEAYLNRAEAYLQKYKAGDAGAGQLGLNDLNTLRRNRINTATYTDWTLTGADQLLADCRAERRREMFWEDQRWFDLRRYGMPSIEHVFCQGPDKFKYTLQEKDPQYVLPIPNIVMQLNPLLVQNTVSATRPGVKL